MARRIALWQLIPNGPYTVTRSSQLLPVRHHGRAAMLKLAMVEEERAGGALMDWWAGRGAAPVLARDAEAVLLERAEGGRSLAAMARGSQDEDATGIICRVAAELHAPRRSAPPELVPLETWFAELARTAPMVGGVLRAAWEAANELLGSPRDVGVLHGDIHHDNILDFGPRGWLAIDPKGLRGERGFDYANLFRNPDGTVALRRGRFERHVFLVAELAGLERTRLLQWILAVMGLSATWHIADAEPPSTTLAVAAMAAAALGRPTS